MPSKLNPNQMQAAKLLSQGLKSCEVATEVSVTPQTISEWKKKPEFEAMINWLTMESLESARSKLQHATTDAVDALLELSNANDAPETRRKAALDILRLTGHEPDKLTTFAWGIGKTTV